LGWDSCNAWQSKADVVTAIKQDHSGGGWTLIDSSVVGNTYFGLHERTDAGNLQRLITVCLISKAGGTWGYKSMSEDMGPYYFNCPLRILDKADEVPAVSYSATEWRANCRAHAKREKAIKSLAPGVVVRLVSGLKFQGMAITHAVVASAKPLVVIVDGGQRASLKRTMIAEIIGKPESTVSAE
jgi:hypothetical protein